MHVIKHPSFAIRRRLGSRVSAIRAQLSPIKYAYKAENEDIPSYIYMNEDIYIAANEDIPSYIFMGYDTFVEKTFVESTFVEGTLVEWNIGRTEHWSNRTLVEQNIGRTDSELCWHN